MSNAVSAQHPAVVLRSSYRLVRALLAVAAIAIGGLTIAVVVLAINSGTSTSASPAAHVIQPAVSANQAVQPNPDEQGLTAAPVVGNVSYFYPGHF
jgi:hypothetical protein